MQEKNDTSDIIKKKFTYKITKDKAILLEWIGSKNEKKVTIPSFIEDKPVFTVPSNLFKSFENSSIIEEIIIEEGIKEIEKSAFFNCRGVKKYFFPKSIEKIDDKIFAFRDGRYKDSFLNKNVVFITPLNSYADLFLKNYSVIRYGKEEKLNVYECDEQANDYLSKLLSILTIYDYKDGVGIEFKEKYLSKDFFEKKINIPMTLNNKPVVSFSMNNIPEFVTDILLPSTINNIENLENFNIPCNLENLEISLDNENFWSDGKAIFTRNKKKLLRYVSFNSSKYTIPYGTEVIGSFAFSKIKNLKELTIPKTVSYIDDYAFKKCDNLEKLFGLENKIDIGKNIFGDELYSFKNLAAPFISNNDIVIIGSSIFKYAVYDKEIIEIPEGITKICAFAFSGYRKEDMLRQVILPSTVKSIEKNAFSYRNKLETINIPNGVEVIDENIFLGCEKLKKLFIPQTIKKIFVSAFPHNEGNNLNDISYLFSEIDVDKNNNYFCSNNGILYTKNMDKLLFVPNNVNITSFRIMDSVKYIGELAFSGNEFVKELFLSNSVLVIEKNAFSNCSNLECIHFNNNLERIEDFAFYNCKKISEVLLPKKVNLLGSNAFEKTSIEKLYIPNSVTTIGEETFAKTCLKRVSLPKSICNIGWGCFSGVKEIEIFDSIDSKALNAYDGIDLLNGIPNSMVGYIGIGSAFGIWKCALNHRWLDYSIIVKSSDDDKIKYKVWMGASSEQEEYRCFLASAWGKNGTFAFKELDKKFNKLKCLENKIMIAKYRLDYPIELSKIYKIQYENFLKCNNDI